MSAGLPSSFLESNKTDLSYVQRSEAVMEPIDLPLRDESGAGLSAGLSLAFALQLSEILRTPTLDAGESDNLSVDPLDRIESPLTWHAL
jgi:hypothetical protein